MKKVCLVLVFLITGEFIFCQSVKFSDSIMIVERHEKETKIISLPLECSGIKDSINIEINSINPDTDAYQLLTNKVTLYKKQTNATIEFRINSGKVKDAKSDKVYLSLKGLENIKHSLFIIEIINAKSKTQSNLINDIIFMNAYNFEFGDTKIQNKYVAQFGLYAPNLTKNKWGFNTGIMHINYAVGDSAANTQSANAIENVQISPLDILTNGSKYLRQFNEYSYQTKFSTWSFYVQPLLQLRESQDKHKIYLHGHLELLASKYTFTTIVNNKLTDTAIFNSAAPVDVRNYISNKQELNKTFLSGYFGAGFTFDLNPWPNGRFFIQPTVGINTSSIAFNSVQENNKLTPNKELDIFKTVNWFYLIRSNYQHKLGEESDLIVGVDIRGRFPLYAPNYAAYVGVDVGINKLLSIFK